ncbi:MAG: T9SS C-terminal target domain-containing protein, partial [Calditrichaeota bacterium]
KGDIQVTGGDFSMSRGEQGGSGVTIWRLEGNISLSNATTQNANSPGAKLVLAGNGALQRLSLTNVTYGDGGLPLEVDNGAVLDMGASMLAGNGLFHLNAGATLFTSRADGIDGAMANTGVRVLEEKANYGFNGEISQTTGSLLPQSVNGFILDNDAGISLSHSVTVTGFMRMIKGKVILNGKELTYGADGSLEYRGTAVQTTSDAEFPSSGGPQNLIINNSRSVTLHDSRFIHGNVELNGDLNLGSFTLTAGSTSHADDRAFIETADGGTLALTSIGSSAVLFPVGTTAYAPVWVANAGAVDTISVGVVRDSGPAPYGGRVTVKWNIQENTAGGGDYTLQFGWMNNLENPAFRNDRLSCAGIFNLTDTTQVGTGSYMLNLDSLPKTIARAGIVALGPFAVGRFSESTGIIDSNPSVADEFFLRQNYPNPFNPWTAIDFSLGKSSTVEFTVYDILGRVVETLVNGKMEAGIHTVRWDASGKASGVYFYQLKTDQFVQIQKMVFVQ